MRRDLHGAQMTIVGLLRQELLVDELQIQNPPFERERAEREAGEQQRRCANARDRPPSFSHPASFVHRFGSTTTTSCSSARHREVHAFARETPRFAGA